MATIGRMSNEVDPAKFETKLGPKDERKFQKWLDQQHQDGNIHNGDYRFYKQNGYGYDYDFRAAFQKQLQPGDNGHWDDYGKKPNHPSFSVYSKYANAPGVQPGSWNGDQYVPNDGVTGIPTWSPGSWGN